MLFFGTMIKTSSELNLVSPPPEVLPLSDGELRTEDGASFPIFKIKLIEGSDYFYRLFCGVMGKERRTYTIPDIRGDVMKLVLSFLYSGRVEVTDSNAGDLLVAADYLLADGLTARIVDGYIRKKMSVFNCLTFFASALQTRHEDLVRECFRFIQVHFEAAIAADSSGAVARLPLQALEQLLASGSLRLRDEAPVWEAIRGWVEGDPEDRLRRLPALLKHLALRDVDGELADRILESPIVADNPACGDLRAVRGLLWRRGSCFVLERYLLKQRGPEPAGFGSRRPPCVHFGAFRLQATNRSTRYALLVTFDEEIDLWRRVALSRTYPDFAFALGRSLYLFNKSKPFVYRFGLVEGKWHCCLPPSSDDRFLSVVHLDGKLLVVLADRRVKAYSPRREKWTKVPPMRVDVRSPVAVSIGQKVYVIGHVPPSTLVAQAYCAKSACWWVFRPPSFFYPYFELVAHGEKLYYFGEQQVEVYDPDQQEWKDHKPLPLKIRHPKATVLNDRLIVCSELESCMQPGPAFVWDECHNCWNPIDKSCDIRKFRVFSAIDRECVGLITKQNRNSWYQFTNIPIERRAS